MPACDEIKARVVVKLKIREKISCRSRNLSLRG